jgi:hypothetical protein
LSLTTGQDDFTTFNSQISKIPRYRLNYKQASNNLISKVNQWLNKYGNLSVGSFNQNRTKKYHRIFKNMQFNLTPIEYNENTHLPPSWDFLLLSHHPDAI